MKSKYVLLASALLISVSNFAQKDQIKAAEKAMKNGNSAEAISVLNQAETLITSATDGEKAQYYFVKGNAHLDMATKKMEVAKNLSGAAKAYQEVLSIEKAAGKSKYSQETLTAVQNVKNSLLNLAQTEGENKNYMNAADLLYSVYEMDKANYDNLYFAAYYYMAAEDYKKALPYFEDLKKANYTGESISYYAKNAVSDQEEYYGNTADAKKNRDNQVRLKLATTPRDEKTPSRKADIAKYIASIYISQGKNAEAKAAIAEAKQVNPDDIDLLNAEAEIYLKMGDMATYKTLTEKIIEKNPNDYNLFFNLGIASAKTDPVAAENYYQKSISLKPDFQGSYINLAILKMRDEQKIVEEMNKLGTSEKDNKRYEVLKKQRDEMYRSAIPSLEKAYELKPETEVGEMLLSIYGALELSDKKKALKAKMGK